MHEFEGVSKQKSLQLLQHYAKELPTLDVAEQNYENIVMGCTTQVASYYNQFRCTNRQIR